MATQASLIENDTNALKLNGSIERVLFASEENGYCVLKILPDTKNADSIAAVGIMPKPQVGNFLSFTGNWVMHARFGKQFQFTSFEERRPESLEGMRMFLASGVIKGMGKTWAKRVVEHFGLDTFKVLDNEPDRLLEIPKISKKLIKSIQDSWAEQVGIRELMVFLNPHGIGPALAVRIYRQYGANAIDVIKENPYRMAMEIRGVGFLTADQFAISLGFELDSPLRAQAGTFYILSKQVDDGHVYFPKDKLIALAASQLCVDEQLIEDALQYLEKGKHIVSEYFDEHTAIYLSDLHHCETKISFYLGRLLASPKVVFFKDYKRSVEEVISTLSIKLAENQQEAVYTAAQSKMMILTGGPGTGKTTIINAIIRVFQKVNAKILLAAPTGRAAKRMSETSGLEAKTIHRLLEYNPAENAFAKNENNPLSCSLLIVDEASMVDLYLMYSLVKAIPLGCTVLLVGDINQLPSVGAGNVLKDCIYSERIPLVELNEIFRQAAKSQIIQNAHKINEGSTPSLTIDKEGLSDFYFLPEEDPDKACQTIIDLASRRLPKKYKFNSFSDIQVLSPMLKGASGVNNLNTQLQIALNPHGTLLQRGEKNFRLNDKVMQIKNNYDKDIYNGDIGIISEVDLEEKSLLIRFDERYVHYAYEELDELTLAYAISIHKSQGGEYPCIIVPILSAHFVLLQRNLIYTAITRGKKLVVIVGSPKAMHIAVSNNRIHTRYTKLADRLKLSAEAI